MTAIQVQKKIQSWSLKNLTTILEFQILGDLHAHRIKRHYQKFDKVQLTLNS